MAAVTPATFLAREVLIPPRRLMVVDLACLDLDRLLTRLRLRLERLTRLRRLIVDLDLFRVCVFVLGVDRRRLLRGIYLNRRKMFVVSY